MMTDATPYRLRPATEIAKEQACMREIFARAVSVPFIREAFGGTGITAGVLRERFPTTTIVATDLDLQCVETYNRTGYGHCEFKEALAAVQSDPPFDNWGASLDYNRFTLLDLCGRASWKMTLLNEVMNRRPTWLQITDSAAPYLHLNAVRYKLKTKTQEEYINAFVETFNERWPETALIAWAGHRAASYLLFERN